METVTVVAPNGETRGNYECSVNEPWYFMSFGSSEEYEAILVDRGDVLRRTLPSGETIDLPVIGVAIENLVFAARLRVLAPRPITTPNPDADHIVFDEIELRAGTTIIGGRDSGFYDSEGVIVEAIHVGGDPDKYEDWAYYVIGKSNFRQEASQWITLDNIAFPTANPSALFDFAAPKSNKIDELIAEGQAELFEYLVSHPTAVGNLTGAQFEAVMVAIYKNLGFDVEPVGRWNQADGGVDIIAISKTHASTDFRIAIQCKASKNKISARPIRELAGVLDKFKAHQGIVATTSRFTGPARTETEGHFWMLALQDRDSILRRLMAIVRPEFKKFIDALEAQL